MDEWTQGAGLALNVKHGLEQQQMFVIDAMLQVFLNNLLSESKIR